LIVKENLLFVNKKKQKNFVNLVFALAPSHGRCCSAAIE